MRHIAGIALTTAALFLVVVSVMLGSGGLFYMSTAMIATIAASRLQAWLSVRGLRIERIAPETVTAGEYVTVEMIVWSDRKIRRPLVTVVDNVPADLYPADRTASLPIAPAYDQPIRAQYQFRPLRRGKFRWSGVTVHGTDALGLVTMKKQYATDTAEMTVLPMPIPVNVELPLASAWGISEAESGRSRGAGIEPRGVREYVTGDPLRHIHWASSARTGTLLVKEFEAGTHSTAAFILQRTIRTDVGQLPHSSFEIMCGQVAFLADTLLRQGFGVEFSSVVPKLEGVTHQEKYVEILHLLASINADSLESVSQELLRASSENREIGAFYVLLTVADPDLPAAIQAIRGMGRHVVTLVYDANVFQPVGARTSVKSAASPESVYELEKAGAFVVAMPTEETR